MLADPRVGSVLSKIRTHLKQHDDAIALIAFSLDANFEAGGYAKCVGQLRVVGAGFRCQTQMFGTIFAFSCTILRSSLRDLLPFYGVQHRLLTSGLLLAVFACHNIVRIFCIHVELRVN